MTSLVSSKPKLWQWDRSLAELTEDEVDFLSKFCLLVKDRAEKLGQWQYRRAQFLLSWAQTPSVSTISQQSDISEPIVRKWKAQFNTLKGEERIYWFVDNSKACMGGRKSADEDLVMKALNRARAKHGEQTRLADVQANCKYSMATIHRTLARKGITAETMWQPPAEVANAALADTKA